jgi:hypothetical protein
MVGTTADENLAAEAAAPKQPSGSLEPTTEPNDNPFITPDPKGAPNKLAYPGASFDVPDPTKGTTGQIVPEVSKQCLQIQGTELEVDTASQNIRPECSAKRL